jgi:hypothetical protein
MQKRASLNEKFNGLAAARFTKQANMLTDLLSAGTAKALDLGAGVNAKALEALNSAGLPSFNSRVIGDALRVSPETLRGLAGLGLGAGALGAAGLGAAKAAPKINKAIAGMSPEQKKKALKMLAGAGAVGGAGGGAAMYGDDVLAAIQKLR